MAYAFCPECDNRINVGRNPREGQLVTCPSCEAELEIISLDPLELDWVMIDEEDEGLHGEDPLLEEEWDDDLDLDDDDIEDDYLDEEDDEEEEDDLSVRPSRRW